LANVCVLLQSGKAKEAALAEVDIQQLGKQAVVKVVCNRRPGHVLRVLNALEECKVEVLQSNVMTVADNSIHFVTVQVRYNLDTLIQKKLIGFQINK
jgi:UTP:GlnB (protein PII) uridylyltransferase